MHINNSVFLRDGSLVLIDRRYLPLKQVEYIAADYEQAAEAIEMMVVQGAGDIAIAAGYGLYLAARAVEKYPPANRDQAQEYLLKARQRLIKTRPTGHHLASLLNKIISGMDWNAREWSGQILEGVDRAVKRQQMRSELTGKWAAEALSDGDCILTHCFPGPALLYMLEFARQQGKQVEVIATETRPYLQGARLTAWSVSEMGIPTTLITDNMVAFCMGEGMINKVFTAADRIAMDGTIANKIGTFQLALIARYHQVPFYVLGYGGPDRSCANARDIPIEIRDPEEVLTIAGVKTSGGLVRGFYPAFDLTPPQLVQEIITDRGSYIPFHIHHYPKKHINSPGIELDSDRV